MDTGKQIEIEVHEDGAITARAARPLPILVGDRVFYVLNDGKVRPAIVVETWGPACANLLVFMDGTNDIGRLEGDGGNPVMCVTSRCEDAQKAPGTWHRKWHR